MRINRIDAQKGYYLQPQKTRNDVSFGLIHPEHKADIKKILGDCIFEMHAIKNSQAVMAKSDGKSIWVEAIDDFFNKNPGKDKCVKLVEEQGKNLEDIDNLGFFNADLSWLTKKFEWPTIKPEIKSSNVEKSNTPQKLGKVEEIMKSVEDGDGYNPFDGYRY